MAYITRIKTNQISDGNVTAAKIATGTLVGSLFAPDLSLNSNLNIIGNLNVSGNTSTINSVNTYIQDPLVVFNNGYTGSMVGYDVGIIVNRNFATLSTYGAVNTAWVWDENDQAFEALATTSSGNAITSLTKTGFANLKVGNIVSSSISATGTISATNFSGPFLGTTGSFTTLVATNLSTGNAVISGGYVTGLANIQATNISGTNGVVTNFSTANALITGGAVNGLTTLGATTGVVTNLSSANTLITSGRITTGVVTNFSSANIYVSGGYAQGLANVRATEVQSTNFSTANAVVTSELVTTGVVTNFSTANAVITGAGSYIGSIATPIANIQATNSTLTNLNASSIILTGTSNGTWGVANVALYNSVTTEPNSTNNFYLTYANTAVTGNAALSVEAMLSYQPSSGNLSAGYFIGSGQYLTGITGITNGTVTQANVAYYTQVTPLTTNQSFYLTFSNTAASGGNTITGVSSGITVNPSTNTLTVSGISSTNLGSTTGVVTNFSSANTLITSGSATTFVATNLSTSNIDVNGGTVDSLTTLSATTGVVTNFSSANTVITNGVVTTGVVTNFSTANARIAGGYFTGVANVTTTGFATIGGNLVAASGTVSNGTNTGALVVVGGAGVSGNVSIGGNIVINGNGGATGQFLQSTGTGLQWTTLAPTSILNGTSNVSIATTNGPIVLTVNSSNVAAYSSTGQNINGTLVVSGTTQTSSPATGALIVAGGVGVAKDVYIGGNLTVQGTVYEYNTEIVTGTEIIAGNLVANSGINSTSTTTGAIVVVGGLGMSKDLYVGGISNFTGNMTAGNIQVTGNINVIGSTNIITGTSGQFYGNAAGFGALYAGIPTGFTYQPQTTLQISSNFNGYAQLNQQNINSGPQASSDFIATADNGTANDGYIDMGIASSTYNYPGFGLLHPNDGYLLVYGNTTTGGGNLVLGAGGGGLLNDIVFAVVGFEHSNEFGRIEGNGNAFVIKSTTAATNTTSGAIQVAGGIGVAGQIYGGGINATTGSITTAVATNFSTGNARITAGSATTFVATNLSSGNVILTGTSNGTWGVANVSLYDSVVPYTTNQTFYPTFSNTVTAGNSTQGVATNFAFNPGAGSGTLNVGTLVASTVNASTIGNTNTSLIGGTITSTSATIITVNSTTANLTNVGTSNIVATSGSVGTLVVPTGFSTANAVLTGGSLNNMSIGATTASTGAFTTLNTSGTANLNNLFTANAQITNGSVGTLVATTGFSTANSVITNEIVTTGVITNFSTGNARISGGYADNFAVGANTAATGRFTTLAVTTGPSTLAGNVVLTSGTDVTSTTTGTMILTGAGGLNVGGNAYVANNLYVGSNSLNLNLTNPTIIAVDNGSTYAQGAIQNRTNSGSADWVAYGNNYPGPANDHGWADVGFTGDAFNDPVYSITKANDAYLFGSGANATVGGNLVLATDYTGSYNDIVLGVGSFYANSEVARFHGNTSNSGYLNLAYTTNASPALNTGALRVQGGASFGGNVYFDDAVMINGSKTAGQDFIVKGATNNSLIWARPNATYDTVIIGNSASASTVVNGAKLMINTTDAIMLPVGTTSQRPGSIGYTDVAGMLRYSTTANAIEWFNGTTWASAGTTYAVITDTQYNGDGVTTVFTLPTSSTTSGAIVNINGVIQIPLLAYSVSGTVLTFTEAPLIGDVIDVRLLTATTSVTSLNDTAGFNTITAYDTGVFITSGTSTNANTAHWNTDGVQVSTIANVSVPSANSPVTVDTLNNNLYRTGKYVVQVTNGANYQAMEALVITNGTTASITTYGVVQTGGNLGVLSATQSGTNVLVQFTAANASTVVRMKKDYLIK